MPNRWRELAQANVSYQRMSMTSGRLGDERQVELVQMALPHVPLGAMEPLAPSRTRASLELVARCPPVRLAIPGLTVHASLTAIGADPRVPRNERRHLQHTSFRHDEPATAALTRRLGAEESRRTRDRLRRHAILHDVTWALLQVTQLLLNDRVVAKSARAPQ